MRKLFLLLFICLAALTHAQKNKAKFGYCAVDIDTLAYFYYKTPVADTTINGLAFKKMQIARFNTLNGPQTISYEYEHRSNKQFMLYNQQLKLVHSIVLATGKTNQGTIFGREGEVKSDFKLTLGASYDYMRSSMYTSYAHYYLTDTLENSVYFNRSDYTLGATKQTIDGKVYSNITLADTVLPVLLKNNAQATANFALKPLDMMQLKFSMGNGILGMSAKMLGLDEMVQTLICVGDNVNDKKGFQIAIKSTSDNYNPLIDNNKYFVEETDSAYVYEQGFSLKKGTIKTNLYSAAQASNCAIIKLEDNNIYNYKYKENIYSNETVNPLFFAECIFIDTIAGKPFPILVQYEGNANGEIKKQYSPLLFPFYPTKELNDDNFPKIDITTIYNPIYLKLGIKEYGIKTLDDSTSVHPLVKNFLNHKDDDNYSGVDSEYGYDYSRMAADSIAMADSTRMADAAAYSYSNYNEQSFGTVNILTAKKMQVAVYSKSDADNIVIDVVEYNPNATNDFPSVKSKKYAVKSGWNLFELKGIKLEKWKTYKITIYSKREDSLYTGDARSFVYSENGLVLDELTPVYNNYYGEDY